MQVDYRKLWIRLIEEGIKNKTDLIHLAEIYTNILAKLNKDEFVSMGTLKKNCAVLNCDIGYIASLNQRIIKELNKNEPHEVTEDFTFKRPTAFIFNGCAYTELDNWTAFFTQFTACAEKLNPVKIKEMAEMPELISKQNKKYYSTDKKDLCKPAKIMNDFYVETNLSANDFAKRMIEILKQLGMKTSDITIYLRQDRNA